jgi:hypothetical protein
MLPDISKATDRARVGPGRKERLRAARPEILAILLDRLHATHARSGLMSSPATAEVLADLERRRQRLLDRWNMRMTRRRRRGSTTATPDESRQDHKILAELWFIREVAGHLIREETEHRYGLLQTLEGLPTLPSPAQVGRLLNHATVRRHGDREVPPQMIADLFAAVRNLEERILGKPVTPQVSREHAKKLLVRPLARTVPDPQYALGPGAAHCPRCHSDCLEGYLSKHPCEETSVSECGRCSGLRELTRPFQP